MSIRKRGNSYQVTYRCPGEPTPRTETFHSEEEALIRDMQIKLSKKNGTFEPPVRLAKGSVQQQKRDITMSEFLDEYIQVYGLKKWGNSYYTACVGLLKNYVRPYLGNRYVRSITVKDIDSYYTMLLDQPAVVVSGHMDIGAKVSAKTVAKIHKLLKSAFGKAVVWEYTSVNPTIGATLPEQKPAKRDVWSDAEAIQALSVCENSLLRVAMYLALGCSLRLGELLALQWDRVHMDDSLVASGEAYIKIDRELRRCSNESIEALEKVNRSTILFKFPRIMPKKGTTTLVLKAPKTESSNRIVYLPAAVVEELRKVKQQQEAYKALLADEYADYGLVIAQMNGHPYEQKVMNRLFYDLIRENGLRPVVFHSLRHSSTSLKLKLSRGNIKAVQGDTGHSEARMVTDTYAHTFDADRKLIAQEMDSGFFSKVGAPQIETAALDNSTVEKVKLILLQYPELFSDLLPRKKKDDLTVDDPA